ncbi:huntingtin interacting protein-like protein, partial [Leptotrombidium deliense]
MFDYLEEILSLQASVFGSLDMSRANSMTSAGQRRLAPLIPCIQDSSQLYDFNVKVFFKLHAVLPPGTLSGHRDRFLYQFKSLKQFYLYSANLQYFRNLIQVPLLPENPPNFLHASEIHSHVTPVVVLSNHPDSPNGSESINLLVDLSIPCNNSEQLSSDTQSEFSMVMSENGYHTIALNEKDRIISLLMSKIDNLEMEIQQLKIEDGRLIDTLKRKISEIEEASEEQNNRLRCVELEKEICMKKLCECKQELLRHQKGTDAQPEMAKANEKYAKMRDIYN